MKAELVAEYLTSLRLKNELTYEAIAKRSNKSESTVKKICNGQTEDPRLDTVAPIVYAMGGSIDEMFNPGKSKDEIKETSVMAMRDIYENQLNAIKESYDAQINSIRTHYEQHHQDLVDNFEKRLADKQEIINTVTQEKIKLELQLEKKEKDTKKGNLIRNIFIIILGGCLIALLVAELLHPEHGWLTFRTLK